MYVVYVCMFVQLLNVMYECMYVVYVCMFARRQVIFKTVRSIRQDSMLVGASTDLGPVTNSFMLQLNAHSASVALLGAPNGVDTCPEMGLDSVGFLADDMNTPISTAPLDKKLCMHFAGSVSRVAVKNSLPLCKAFGVQFFLQPGTLTSLGNEGFSFAWSVPVAKFSDKGKDKAKGKASVDPDILAQTQIASPLKVNVTKTMFKFTYKTFHTEKFFDVELSLYSLVPAADFEHTPYDISRGYVNLSRPFIEGQVLTIPKGKGKGKGPKGENKRPTPSSDAL
jgi:hypothetical protein